MTLNFDKVINIRPPFEATGREGSDYDFKKDSFNRNNYSPAGYKRIYGQPYVPIPNSERVIGLDFPRRSHSATTAAIEGSFYEWRKIMLDCTASCGVGMWLIPNYSRWGDQILVVIFSVYTWLRIMISKISIDNHIY